MNPAPLFHFAAEFEFYVFAVAFVASVCILSLAASWFLIKTVIAHTFPDLRRFTIEHGPEGFRLRLQPRSSA